MCAAASLLWLLTGLLPLPLPQCSHTGCKKLPCGLASAALLQNDVLRVPNKALPAPDVGCLQTHLWSTDAELLQYTP